MVGVTMITSSFFCGDEDWRNKLSNEWHISKAGHLRTC